MIEDKKIIESLITLSMPIKEYSKKDLIDCYNSLITPTENEKKSFEYLLNNIEYINDSLRKIDEVEEKKYDDQLYLKKWKEIQTLLEAQKHQQYIATICLVLCFMLIPLVIGIIMMIIIAMETKKINKNIKELIHISVIDGKIYSIQFYTQYIDIATVYSSLESLFKNELKNYKLTSNRLFIEKKEI